MSIASEIVRINTNIANAYNEAEAKGATMPATENSDNLASTIATISGGTPPITTGGMFTGATIPLTYKDNTHTYENTYEYKSANYNITITGLTGRATITGNGTKEVSVAFDVTSATSSLAEFTISLSDGTNTYEYKGLHAHYGTTVTGILTLAYTNIPRTGTGTIGTEYKFIESADTDLPCFSSSTTLWNTIYSYQVLNVLIGNFSSTNIGNNFLSYCHSFNQPLDMSGITTISAYFLSYCYSFNQPLDISGISNPGIRFLFGCYSFNQPLDISGISTIGVYFLNNCRSFNQQLDVSGISTIGANFLSDCYSFNQPLDISGITTISNSFLSGCSSFNQPLDISGISTIGTGFLQNCYSLSTIIYNSTTFPTDNLSLSQTSNSKTDTTNGAGILVYGTQRAGLLVALPNRTTSPFRKLIDGGAD